MNKSSISSKPSSRLNMNEIIDLNDTVTDNSLSLDMTNTNNEINLDDDLKIKSFPNENQTKI
jgi:hypothetical protein